MLPVLLHFCISITCFSELNKMYDEMIIIHIFLLFESQENVFFLNICVVEIENHFTFLLDRGREKCVTTSNLIVQRSIFFGGTNPSMLSLPLLMGQWWVAQVWVTGKKYENLNAFSDQIRWTTSMTTGLIPCRSSSLDQLRLAQLISFKASQSSFECD